MSGLEKFKEELSKPHILLTPTKLYSPNISFHNLTAPLPSLRQFLANECPLEMIVSSAQEKLGKCN